LDALTQRRVLLLQEFDEGFRLKTETNSSLGSLTSMHDRTKRADVPKQALLRAGFRIKRDRVARKCVLIGALALGLVGCAGHYAITLSNSDTIIATTRPKLDGHGYYVFKDASGKTVRISEFKVRQIEAK
jgi:hypothetical protein